MKAIILDFDGTIADSFDIFLEALAATLRRPPLPAEQVAMLRNIPTKEIIKHLKVKPWQLVAMITQGRREITARMDRVRAFEGMPEVIQELALHHSLYILSTNSGPNIAGFLKKYRLTSAITRVYGNVGLMGKVSGLKKLIKQERLDPAECVYVGDETRDIEAARKVGISCVAVAWGYNHPAALRSYDPDGLAQTPQALSGLVA